MTETKTATRKLTFNDGLPMGVHATFTHEGQKWIAVPLTKYQKIGAVLDRMGGLFSHINKLMVSWVNSWPEDGAKVAQIMEIAQRARAEGKAVTMERVEALTWIKDKK